MVLQEEILAAGAMVLFFYTKVTEKKLVKGFRLTTNNRMELLAVIVGLEALKSLTKTLSFTLIQNML